MNLHPILVHFPIALLSIYALMELIRWRRLTNTPYWFYVKALFLMIGGLGALAAYFTGDMARFAERHGDFISPIANFKQVVSLHETFAKASVAIFGILAASYLIMWLNREGFGKWLGMGGVWNFLVKLAHVIAETKLVILLALLGLACITITGGLGGVMVYGTKADPFFAPIYNILFPQ